MAQKDLRGFRVAALAADGFEQVELTSPVKALQRHGAEVEIISLRRGNIKGMNLLWPGRKVHVHRTIFTADPDHYDALLIPGGFINPDLLRQNKWVLQFVRDFDRANKPIATICHGPWVLVSAGLVQGRYLASWPGIKDDILNAGGHWKNKAVVRDGNWISSKGPQNLPLFNPAMLDHFAAHAQARQLESEYEHAREHAREKEFDHDEREGDGRFSALGLFAAGLTIAAAILGGKRILKTRRDQQAVDSETEPEVEDRWTALSHE